MTTVTPFSLAPEFLSWRDVDNLLEHLLPQLQGAYDGLIMVTRGGIVPGGLIAEALDLRHILTAAIEFPNGEERRLAWPTFLQFPAHELLCARRILVVDDIWENGRTISAVLSRVRTAGGTPDSAVLHYKPGSNLFRSLGPNYYAAITDRFVVYPWEIDRGFRRPRAETYPRR